MTPSEELPALKLKIKEKWNGEIIKDYNVKEHHKRFFKRTLSALEPQSEASNVLSVLLNLLDNDHIMLKASIRKIEQLQLRVLELERQT